MAGGPRVRKDPEQRDRHPGEDTGSCWMLGGLILSTQQAPERFMTRDLPKTGSWQEGQ